MKKNITKATNKKPDSNNGVTTQWLIDLSKSILDNDWVDKAELEIEYNEVCYEPGKKTIASIDLLSIYFKDINGDKWAAIVRSNQIVEIKLYGIKVTLGDGKVKIMEETKNGYEFHHLEGFCDQTIDELKEYLNTLPNNASKHYRYEIDTQGKSKNVEELMKLPEVIVAIDFLMKRGYYIMEESTDYVKLQKMMTEVCFITENDSYTHRYRLCIHDDGAGKKETDLVLILVGKILKKYGYKRGENILDKNNMYTESADEWYKYFE
jgi:hypothetical protein